METGIAGSAVYSQVVEVGMEAGIDVSLSAILFKVCRGWSQEVRSIPADIWVDN